MVLRLFFVGFEFSFCEKNTAGFVVLLWSSFGSLPASLVRNV